jgi:hypothetical protein
VFVPVCGYDYNQGEGGCHRDSGQKIATYGLRVLDVQDSWKLLWDLNRPEKPVQLVFLEAERAKTVSGVEDQDLELQSDSGAIDV